MTRSNIAETFLRPAAGKLLKAHLKVGSNRMEKLKEKLASGLVCVLMIVVICVSSFIGGCNEMVELASGAAAYMKCHWTYVAASYIAALGMLASIGALFAGQREAQRFLYAMNIAVCIAIACIQTADIGIGVCAGAGMQCHATALVVWIAIVAAGLVSVVQLFASFRKASLPKKAL